MKHHIRSVEPKDLEQLVKLCAAHAQYEAAEYQFDGKEEALRQALFMPTSTLKCLVVEQEKELTGYATFIIQFSTWDACHYLYMDCLFLKEGHRGQGIGKQLLDIIKLEAVKLGCSQIQWQTPSSNTKAIKFYVREGATSKEKVRFFLATN